MMSFKEIIRKLSPSEIEERRIQQVQGVGSDTILRTLGPIIEKRVEELSIKFIQCPPDLPAMLDIRAQFAEVHRLKKELLSMKELGKEAGEALGEMFNNVS
ncbi:MAG: hypothetical protein L0Y56_02245 [Nitrospira sp.]|nr:hypothetical protein [Nitrospira sp.]